VLDTWLKATLFMEIYTAKFNSKPWHFIEKYEICSQNYVYGISVCSEIIEHISYNSLGHSLMYT